MSAKTSAEVVIDGKVYTLSGYEGEEYLQKVASYINGKINEFTSIEEYRHIPLNMKNTLIQLNIADDYFKAKDQVEKLERDLENKEKAPVADSYDTYFGGARTDYVFAADITGVRRVYEVHTCDRSLRRHGKSYGEGSRRERL